MGRRADSFQHCGSYKLCSSDKLRRISREQRHSLALHGTIQRWSGLQNPGQIAKRIQAGLLSRLDQAVDHRTGPGAQRSIGKEEVLSANYKGLDAALGPVVAQLQPSILQIPQEIGPLLLEVMQGFAQCGLGAAETKSAHAKSASKIGFSSFRRCFVRSSGESPLNCSSQANSLLQYSSPMSAAVPSR